MRTKKYVPFYYSLVGQERFLIDKFYYDNVSDAEREKAIGNYDKLPRGVLKLTSGTIDGQSLVNKRVRGNFIKEENDGQLRSYSAEFLFIPITMNMECTIKCSTETEMMRIWQKIITNRYKNTPFQVDTGNIRIPSTLSIPEDIGQERLFEFSFDDRKTYEIKFDVMIKTSVPDVDDDTMIFSGTRMESFNANIIDTYSIDSEIDTVSDGQSNPPSTSPDANVGYDDEAAKVKRIENS